MTDPVRAVEAQCDEAGLSDSPSGRAIKAIMVTTMQAATDAKNAAEKIGREAGRRAAEAAATETRTALGKLLRQVRGIHVAGIVGLAVCCLALGWFAGRSMPVLTNLGKLTPKQMESLRWNDFGAALNACQAQRPIEGREWCGFTVGWWLSPPTPPK